MRKGVRMRESSAECAKSGSAESAISGLFLNTNKKPNKRKSLQNLEFITSGFIKHAHIKGEETFENLKWRHESAELATPSHNRK